MGNMKIEAMDRAGETGETHSAHFYDLDRNKPVADRRVVAVAGSVDRNSAPQQFIDYVAANYNGVIDSHRPEWHAARLWRAAMSAAVSASLAAPQQVDAVQAVPQWKLDHIQRLVARFGSLCHTHWPLAPMVALNEVMVAVKALASPSPAVPPEPHSCETGQIDEALADFLAEHTSLNQDGIDTHAMKMTLALNYAALHPTPESDIAEWREQGYLPAAAQGAVPEGWKLVPLVPTHEMVRAACDAMGATQSVMRAIEAAPDYFAQSTDTTAPQPVPKDAKLWGDGIWRDSSGNELGPAA